MDLELSAEQEMLRETARGILARHDTLAAARAALDGDSLRTAWPAAVTAGWPGVLVDEDHGGAGAQPLDAMVIAGEAGRVLACTGLLGHLPATAILRAAGPAHEPLLEVLAGGESRAAAVLARPPLPGEATAMVEPLSGATRSPVPRVDGGGRLWGAAYWVPDVVAADVLVVAATDPTNSLRAVLVRSDGVHVEAAGAYDASRPLGHVHLEGCLGEVVDTVPGALSSAWFLAQALLGAEAVGASERLLEMSVGHARRRHAFGRPIGSYQAVKHQLVEVLRRLENARSLFVHAGRVSAHAEDGAGSARYAASALRFVAGDALELAARTTIAVHGGMGATWEHDAGLYHRRAQLDRRLLGGHAGAAEHVGAVLLAAAGREADPPPKL